MRFLQASRQKLSSLYGRHTRGETKQQKPSQSIMTSSDTQILKHSGNFGVLKQDGQRTCDTEMIDVPVGNETVRGFLHVPAGYTEQADRTDAAAILLSGARGGVSGPSGIYISLGDKLASLQIGIPVFRLDYRYPSDNRRCVENVTEAMDYLEGKYSIRKFVLEGWSFGGAPVFTVGGQDKERVVGCATVASQTADTGGIRNLSPRPVLLLHGTGDMILGFHCSQQLYKAYGENGTRTLRLFDGDDHFLTQHSREAEEVLCNFIASCVGVDISCEEQENIVQEQLVDGKDKIELMKKGGDVEGEGERVN